MSIGNLKTQGNKGTNFPFQLGALKLLKQIATVLGATPETVQPKIVNAVVDGLTPANAKSMSLFFSGSGGSFDGIAVPDGTILNYTAGPVSRVIAQAPYVVPSSPGGYILITYLL